MSGDSGVLTRQLVALLALIVLAFAGFALFLPWNILVILLLTTILAVAYFAGAVYLASRPGYLPDWSHRAPLIWMVLFPLVVGAVVLRDVWSGVTLTALLFTLALLLVFMYYWLVVPLALVQKISQQNWTRPDGPWPAVTVLIPAYNEASYVGRCIDSVVATTYPADVRIVVVDDGSTDGTYDEVREHAPEDAVVLRRENGGKHAALNTALEHADTDFVVSVDADSTVAPDALALLVQEFDRHPDAGAIAGNIKVVNRGSFVTNLQALEYIVGINTFRRAFDLLGVVTVVPGSLGAFRRETLHSVGGYSGDTVTEDFDLTIEILKAGHAIHASEGVVYTEGPETWRDLYQQRLRWFGGNIQTLMKHLEVFRDARFGLLHRLGFPYVFLSLSMLPLLGLAVLGLLILAVLQGSMAVLLVIGVFFTLLQFLLSALAIAIEDEDMRLAVYAPFSIVGFKQFLDAVLLKSIVDVARGGKVSWRNVRRARQDRSADRTAPGLGKRRQ